MYRMASMIIPKTTSCVKSLIITNLICWFVLVNIVQKFFSENNFIFQLFGFVPSVIESHFFIWQFFTYMFIHNSGFFHILMNMLVLWMFGSELEKLWRKKFFLIYYCVCGVGAALVYFIGLKLYVIFGGTPAIMNIPVVGASGAVFGLLLAYGLIFGERIILFMFVFPIKARTFTLLIIAMEFFTMLDSGTSSPIANLAHLGGLFSGYVFLKGRSIIQKIRTGYLLKKTKLNIFK